jgi:hypothetical protein
MISIQRLVNRVLFGPPISCYAVVMYHAVVKCHAVVMYHAVACNPLIQSLGIIDSIGNETWV